MKNHKNSSPDSQSEQEHVRILLATRHFVEIHYNSLEFLAQLVVDDPQRFAFSAFDLV